MALSSYFVDFTAYIDERKRPENFPHVIHDKQVLKDVESIPHLQFLVNERFIKLVSAVGIVAMKDEDIVDEGVITFDRRVFVPWHMITHMKLDVNILPPPKSTQDSVVPGHIIPGEPPKELLN